MNEQTVEKITKTDFKAYSELLTGLTLVELYEKLRGIATEFRVEICTKLGISAETFYVKMRFAGDPEKTFNYPQQVVISEITGIPRETLFPQP